MNAFLLYHPKTRPTGRALAKLIGIPFGRAVGPKYAKITDLIRWGNPQDVYIPVERALNRSAAINSASNKYKSLEIMKGAGVSVPWFTRKFVNAEEMKWPILGRRDRHSKGTDIVIYDKDYEGDEDFGVGIDYFIKYIEPHREYRIHVVGDKVLFAQKKYFREQLFQELMNQGGPLKAVEFDRRKDYIRNNDHGWGFHDMEDINNVPECVLDEALGAVASLGLDFGAVDIITSKEKVDGRHKPYVLEVNTAPGLRERNLVKYANYFRDILP